MQTTQKVGNTRVFIIAAVLVLTLIVSTVTLIMCKRGKKTKKGGKKKREVKGKKGKKAIEPPTPHGQRGRGVPPMKPMYGNQPLAAPASARMTPAPAKLDPPKPVAEVKAELPKVENDVKPQQKARGSFEMIPDLDRFQEAEKVEAGDKDVQFSYYVRRGLEGGWAPVDRLDDDFSFQIHSSETTGQTD